MRFLKLSIPFFLLCLTIFGTLNAICGAFSFRLGLLPIASPFDLFKAFVLLIVIPMILVVGTSYFCQITGPRDTAFDDLIESYSRGNPRSVIFGTGHIRNSAFFMNGKAGILFSRENVPHEIGEVSSQDPNRPKLDELRKDEVVLYFTKIESLEVVVGCLTRIYQDWKKIQISELSKSEKSVRLMEKFEQSFQYDQICKKFDNRELAWHWQVGKTTGDIELFSFDESLSDELCRRLVPELDYESESKFVLKEWGWETPNGPLIYDQKAFDAEKKAEA